MTDLLPAPAANASPPGSRRASHRWILGVGVALTLVAAVVALAWWVTHPERFSYGNAVGAGDVAVGESMLFDSGIIPQTLDDTGESALATVRVTDVSPRVSVDEAEAEVTLWLCTRARATGVGSVSANALARFCDPVSEISGPVGDFSYVEQQILVQITPTRPGRVVVRGFDVTYTDGLRRGTEHAGSRLSLEAVSD